MIWSCIIFSILLSTTADKQSTEKIIKEAQQKVMVFLKEPTGVTWLTTLTQQQKAPLRTSELLTAILNQSSPASPATKTAASKLKELLTSENLTQIEFEGWKDLMDNGPQDDVICLYRALNTTLNYTEDWQKFLTSVSQGYMVYLALDMGTKFIICLKKIPVQDQVNSPTPTPLSTTHEAPAPEMGNGSRALNDNLPLNEDACEEAPEPANDFRRQFVEVSPTSPPPCNRPIIYVLPMNYPLQPVNWFQPQRILYQKNVGPYGPPGNFGPHVPQVNFGPFLSSGPQKGVDSYELQVSKELYRNFEPVRSTYGPRVKNERTTKVSRPNFLGFNQLLPIRRSPYIPEQIGPTSAPIRARHWQPPPKCDKNNWRPECFWKPSKNGNQAQVRPTLVDNNFGYRKTLPVKENGPKENPMFAKFWKKSSLNPMNWIQSKIPDPPIQAPIFQVSSGPVSTASAPWIFYNKYSMKNLPTPGPNLGQFWQSRTRPVPGPVPGPSNMEQNGQEKRCKDCLCNLCNRPIVVKVLMENGPSGKLGLNGNSRRTLDPQIIAEAISQTDKNLEDLEKKIREIEKQSGNESEIEESTESSEG